MKKPRAKPRAKRFEAGKEEVYTYEKKKFKDIIVVKPQTEGQRRYINAINENDIVFCIGPAGSGKCQPFSAAVYTPDGKKTMGDIQVGDVVCTPNGKTANVIKTSLPGVKDIYRITFKNGETVECCEDHLWKVNDRMRNHKKYKTDERLCETKTLFKAIKNTSRGSERFSITATQPVQFNERKVKIDPYLMGLYLGDGSYDKDGSQLRITTADMEIVNSIQKYLPEEYECSGDGNFSYRIVRKNRKETWNKNIVKDNFYSYGLKGVSSHNKFIPEDYLYNSIDNRWALLQGLMDTDGTISKNGCCSFSTTSEGLAEDVKALALSLGAVCNITKKEKNTYVYKGEKLIGRSSYNCFISVDDSSKLFRLSRKLERTKKRTTYGIQWQIKKIEKVRREEVKCILVDDKDHMYLTDHFIPTHNSAVATGIALQQICADVPAYEKIVVLRPAKEACDEKIGFLPGDMGEKMAPWAAPIVDNMQVFIDKNKIKNLFYEDKVEIIPLAYLRGRSLNKSFIIVDEAQNVSPKQMLMILTRLGKGSKMIINGDIAQTDIKVESGLSMAYDLYHDIDGIGFMEMDETDIVRHPLVAEIVKRHSASLREALAS